MGSILRKGNLDHWETFSLEGDVFIGTHVLQRGTGNGAHLVCCDVLNGNHVLHGRCLNGKHLFCKGCICYWETYSVRGGHFHGEPFSARGGH